MLQYIVLSVFSIILAIMLLKFFKLKIHSPAIIFIIGYIVSFLLAFVGSFTWNTEHANMLWATVFIIATGIIGFCAGDVISESNIIKTKISIKLKKYIIHKNKFSVIAKKISTLHKENKIYFQISKNLTIQKSVFILSIAIYVLTIILVIWNLLHICQSSSCTANTLPQLISFYRNRSTLFSNNGASFDFLTSQLIKLCNAFTLIYSFIFINNIVNKTKIKSILKYSIPLILFTILTLLQSGRGLVLVYIVAAAIIFMLLYTKKHSANLRQANIQLIKKLLPIAVVIFVLFYAVSPLLGRSTKNSFFDYMSFYFGCPTPSLNLAIRNEIRPSMTHFGENTFRGAYNALDKVGIIEYKQARSMPFVSLSGMHSNVFTSSFRSYIEFGYLGVFLLAAISGYIFGKIHKLADSKNDYRFILLYAFCGANILDMFRDETFYTNFLSTNNLANILVLFIICEFLAYLRNQQIVSLSKKLKRHHSVQPNTSKK